MASESSRTFGFTYMYICVYMPPVKHLRTNCHAMVVDAILSKVMTFDLGEIRGYRIDYL